MVRLSKNFTVREFTRSRMAAKHGIINQPGESELNNMLDLTKHVLQPLRDKICEPIFVTSGYRCPELNALVGGEEDSQHLYGQAGDIDSADPVRMFAEIYNHFDYDQLIWEFGNEIMPAWLHVSFRLGRNRKISLRSILQKNGKIIYEQI